MPSELFLANGFAFDVFAIVTPAVIDAEEVFNGSKNLWTFVPVGNVVGVATTDGKLTWQSVVEESLVRELDTCWS